MMCTNDGATFAPHIGHPPHACNATRNGWALQGKRHEGQRLQSSRLTRLPGVWSRGVAVDDGRHVKNLGVEPLSMQ